MSAVLSLHVTCLPANQPPAGFLPRSLHGSFHSHCRPLTSESDSSAQTPLISASMFCPLWISHTVSAGWHTEPVSTIAKGCHLPPESHTTGPSETLKPLYAHVCNVTCDIPQHLQHVPLPVTLSLAVSYLHLSLHHHDSQHFSCNLILNDFTQSSLHPSLWFSMEFPPVSLSLSQSGCSSPDPGFGIMQI